MFYPKEQVAETCDTKAELTRYYGSNTLSFFGLAQQNAHFLAPGDEGLINYRLEGNVAVVLGDPVCPPEAFERVTRSFLDFCKLRNWRVAFYQTNSDHLSVYRALKLHTFKIGEEAIIHSQTFTLKGSAIANVRISARRAERDAVAVQWYEGVLPVEVINQLEQISKLWLEHKAGQDASEMGFSMGRLSELPGAAKRGDMLADIQSADDDGMVPRVVTGVAITSSGKPCAFVTFLPVYGTLATNIMSHQSSVLDINPSMQRSPRSPATSPSAAMEAENWGWTLDLMRRTPDAPPGVMELLLVRAIERFRASGAQLVSLGMVAMADTRQEMTASQRQLAGFVTDRLHLLESRRSLFNFKQKFQPRWESRYIVTGTTLALPKIALAILRLRNYSAGGVVRLIK
jgi:phosphatidylglycerol lysyltransferase